MGRMYWGALALVAVLVIGALSAFVVESSAANQRYTSAQEQIAKDKAALKVAYAKGQKAGVEYEDWFCTNGNVTAP